MVSLQTRHRLAEVYKRGIFHRCKIKSFSGDTEGLFPAVGAIRKVVPVVLEDIACFPYTASGRYHTGSAKFVSRSLAILNAIIFGHAKDGNIHFVVTQSFNTPAEIEHYDRS